MNISQDIGKLQDIHIHDNGFKQGNYFSVKLAAKNDECIDIELNPEELDMMAMAFLRAVVRSDRWLNIAGEVIDILKGKEVQSTNANG